MHRRALFILAASALVARPAHAIIPVIDELGIAKMLQEIAWLRDQYEVMTQQLRSLTNSLDLNGIGSDLLGQDVRNPLGGITNQLPGIVGGTSLGNIPGASQMLDQDRLYQPTGNDFAATQMNNAATGLANLKALAMNLIGANQKRIGALDGIQSDLQGAEDTSQVERINGRIALENQTLAAQAAQVQQLQAMASLEQRTQEQRNLQRQRADDEAMVELTKDKNTGGVMAPATAPMAFMAGGGG